MDQIYAKTDMTNPGSGTGTVVNTQIINSGDYLDPNYTWTNITTYSPMPGIGWTTTDGVNFTPPGGS